MSYHREAQYMANMIEIEKADPAKIEEYKRIFENSPLYNHYFKKTDLLDKVLSDALKKGEAYVAIDRNGEAVGYMSMKASDPTVDGLPCMTLLGVKDTKRGRGIGQMLIAFYIGVMSGLGFKECALIVNDWNPRARKLYDSLGFKLRRSFEDVVIGGWMNHILVRKL
ncbi:MAG: GNAT family N-acetyltransferase [Oscillospiraceae bacterium]|nr:GNAT family N-acetyltransferase [Oscillospiraceae bacterium]MBR3611633.1 GNAT family N-acetyltransferase [Oscillospiraceae bacterium]MBR3953213.1 GNAT family N-acetyltransferase [Oscillospiraceae bacterium]